VFILLVITLATAASAADEEAVATQPAAPASQPAGPAPDDASSGAGWASLDELSFHLGFEADWSRREVRSGTRGRYRSSYSQINRERRFEETIGVDGGGSLIDDRVFQFDFSGLWGLTQESYSESRPGRDLRTDPDGDVLEYDFRGVLFPEGKLTTEIIASQLDDRVPRPFLPSQDRRRERYGLHLTYHDDVLPMRFRFEDTYESLKAPGLDEIDDEERSTSEFEYEATWRPSEQQQLRLNYEYSDRSEQYSGTLNQYDTVRNYLTLDHQLTFGLNQKSRLETLARFQDETGDLARDVYEISPRLRLQHTDEFATLYKLQYLRDSFEGVDQDLYRGDVGFEYTFDDAWRTAANIYGLYENAERGGDLNEWGGSGQIAYEKDNDWGRLRASLNYEHTHQRIEDTGYDGLVISESVTLRDPLLAYLTRQYIVRYSVVVNSADRTRLYVPGRDYMVVPLGSYTALRRLPTGRIVNNETVLVSYSYRTNEGRELNRDRIDVRIEQRFKSGWTPYYAGTVQFEAIDRQRFLTYDPRDICRHRFGLRYQRQGWSAYGEYEYNDDSVDPYQAGRMGGDIVLLQQVPHELDARIDLSYFDFFGEQQLDERDTLLFDIACSYRLFLQRDLEAHLTSAYRFEDDSLFGVTNGVDVSAGLDWKIGFFTASFEIEYDLLDMDDSRDGTVAAWIKLRRDIPVIARK
jgi:hypothetical protein